MEEKEKDVLTIYNIFQKNLGIIVNNPQMCQCYSALFPSCLLLKCVSPKDPPVTFLKGKWKWNCLVTFPQILHSF
jgi:hypothetical protein